MEGDCLKVRGSLFHSMEDATVNVLSPVCFRLVRYVKLSGSSEDLVCLPGTYTFSNNQTDIQGHDC